MNIDSRKSFFFFNKYYQYRNIENITLIVSAKHTPNNRQITPHKSE